jgi:hypothetical protein
MSRWRGGARCDGAERVRHVVSGWQGAARIVVSDGLGQGGPGADCRDGMSYRVGMDGVGAACRIELDRSVVQSRSGRERRGLSQRQARRESARRTGTARQGLERRAGSGGWCRPGAGQVRRIGRTRGGQACRVGMGRSEPAWSVESESMGSPGWECRDGAEKTRIDSSYWNGPGRTRLGGSQRVGAVLVSRTGEAWRGLSRRIGRARLVAMAREGSRCNGSARLVEMGRYGEAGSVETGVASEGRGRLVASVRMARCCRVGAARRDEVGSVATFRRGKSNRTGWARHGKSNRSGRVRYGTSKRIV